MKAIENPDKTCCWCLGEFDNLHEIKIDSMGYGSSFDCFSTQINLCDDCYSKTQKCWWDFNVVESVEGHDYEYAYEIWNFIGNLPLLGRELVINRYARGAGAYKLEPQDYIDYKEGILTHEKCKKYGLYSKEEISSYKSRFPTCNFPVKYITKHKSYYRCKFGAFGGFWGGQSADPLNYSTECYMCKHYIPRFEQAKIKKADGVVLIIRRLSGNWKYRQNVRKRNG